MNRALVEAELHAHAQQLMRFAQEHRVGFIVGILDDNGDFQRASNLDADELSLVGAALQGPPKTVTTHTVREPS